jgi:hypothetical protein
MRADLVILLKTFGITSRLAALYPLYNTAKSARFSQSFGEKSNSVKDLWDGTWIACALSEPISPDFDVRTFVERRRIQAKLSASALVFGDSVEDIREVIHV